MLTSDWDKQVEWSHLALPNTHQNKSYVHVSTMPADNLSRWSN